MSFTDATQFWNERFNNDEFIFGKAPNEYLVKQTKAYLTPGQKALCIADGEGRNGVWLAKQGLVIEGFDVSDIALDKAKKFADDNQVNIDYSFSDVDSWNWQANSYDAIVAIFIQFADPAMRLRLFKNILLALKPGGIFILQGYTQKQLEYKTGGPILIDQLYTEEMIREMILGLEILDLQSYDAILEEGTRHIGMSALLGLTARKPTAGL